MKEKLLENKKAVIGIIAALIVVIAFIGISKYNASRIEGSYTGKITVLFSTSKDTMTFSKDKTLKEGNNKGTYEIEGNTLRIEFDEGTTMKAKLSKDRKSFVIKSASGLTSMIEGTKYIKNK
ncbi:hypothetical protein Q2T76_07545 [Lactobacillus sp. YT155]|uniref:hypothetical protein n=1 Tax=Lactobacillus sp. YT155 TaxID=3060955 RepID=UPI00265DD490|nr:hypothetical protein [Lactobacillus sp. YT155]MDO1605914.1 hypothetical protein [Lactobacillus sp. YT155]